MDDQLFTKDEAAAYLGVSVGCLNAWRHKGIGPKSWKDYRARIVYPHSGLVEFMNSKSDEVGGT